MKKKLFLSTIFILLALNHATAQKTIEVLKDTINENIDYKSTGYIVRIASYIDTSELNVFFVPEDSEAGKMLSNYYNDSIANFVKKDDLLPLISFNKKQYTDFINTILKDTFLNLVFYPNLGKGYFHLRYSFNISSEKLDKFNSNCSEFIFPMDILHAHSDFWDSIGFKLVSIDRVMISGTKIAIDKEVYSNYISGYDGLMHHNPFSKKVGFLTSSTNPGSVLFVHELVYYNIYFYWRYIEVMQKYNQCECYLTNYQKIRYYKHCCCCSYSYYRETYDYEIDSNDSFFKIKYIGTPNNFNVDNPKVKNSY